MFPGSGAPNGIFTNHVLASLALYAQTSDLLVIYSEAHAPNTNGVNFWISKSVTQENAVEDIRGT
jgi:hypothetical protein